jgi:hypothetical protein
VSVSTLIDQWQQARAELEKIERAEHPDVTDAYGRIWRWRGRGNLYVHDDALAFPLHMIKGLSLPSASLADNPNYDLCATCRQNWQA